jgi:hypothetical protein
MLHPFEGKFNASEKSGAKVISLGRKTKLSARGFFWQNLSHPAIL